MEVRKDLFYTKDHEWVRPEGDIAYVGLCDYAQSHLGEIVYVELPGEGDTFSAKDALAAIESTKAASDLFTPVSGEVIEVNTELEDSPQLLNEAPFDTWVAKIKMDDPEEVKELMNAEEYEKFVAEEA